MNWFKTIVLLGVLGMTWAECGRRPSDQSHAFPDAAYEPASTNAALVPVDSLRSGGSGGSRAFRLAQAPVKGR